MCYLVKEAVDDDAVRLSEVVPALYLRLLQLLTRHHKLVFSEPQRHADLNK